MYGRFCIDVNYLSRTKTRVHDRKVVVWQKHGDCSPYVRGDWDGDSFVRLCDVISASPVSCPGVEAKSEYKVSFAIRQGGVWFDEAVIFEMYFLSDDVENKNVGGTLRRRR